MLCASSAAGGLWQLFAELVRDEDVDEIDLLPIRDVSGRSADAPEASLLP